MKYRYSLLAAAAALAIPGVAFASDGDADAGASAGQGNGRPAASAPAAAAPAMTTGVARARDRLDSATSTSTLDEQTIGLLGARSLAEIFRAIPGMRSEATGGEGFANISIRGLPIALGGAKFLQLEENGLPVLEFGDIAFATSDQFLRADLNLAGIQAIRGGSASTFASNSPGGIVNLIDKTGEVAGGSLMATAGLDYDTQRVDFTYGGPISEGLRFQLGGFYRVGEGPRKVGFNGYKGGQLKFNITRDFSGGYIRVYGKLLDDQTVPTPFTPVRVTGTNGNPDYSSLPGLDYGRDTMFSRFIPANVTLDSNNQLTSNRYSEATRSKEKALGLEAKFELGDWTIIERFRYSDKSGHTIQPYTLSNGLAVLPVQSINTAAAVMRMFSATSLAYATGPNAGQVITNPAGLNGNGLLAVQTNQDTTLNDLTYIVNDLRASRVWNIGEGELTFTAGWYKSSQTIDTAWTWTTTVSDVRGNASANYVNLFAGPVPITQNGYLAYGAALIRGMRRDRYDLTYDIDAPYSSVNFKIGDIAIGGSLRYDFGRARGVLYGTSLPGTVPFVRLDVNGDGAVSIPETRVSSIPYAQPGLVNYNYKYLSYSVSVNYRPSESFSTFARYSKGGRANADRILFSNYVSPVTGRLLVPAAAYDPVKQAELGVKYRTGRIETYVTGFWAKTGEHNISLDRSYRAYGVELESSVRFGKFSLASGATWTKAKITRDAIVPANVGNSPKHQADLIFQLMPKYEDELFTVGAAIQGTTSSFAGDTNQLKMPGWTTVSAFLAVRPVEQVTLMLNANNLFDTKGLVDVDADFIPTSGVVTARTINPRTISASVRFDF